MQAARANLILDLDLHTLTTDLHRVSRLLSLARASAQDAGDITLAAQIATLSSKLVHLFDAISRAISTMYTASATVLNQQLHIYALLSAALASDVQLALTQNDALAEGLEMAASALATTLSDAAVEATHALELAAKRQATRRADGTTLHDQLVQLRASRARAWETHSAMLRSLSMSAHRYSRAARLERQAARRANFTTAFSFVKSMDRFMEDHFSLLILNPLTRMIEEAKRDADNAQLEKREIVAAKKRQRAINRKALNDITDYMRKMEDVKKDVQAVNATVQSLQAVGKELKRLEAAVLRMSSFWTQLKGNIGRLSSVQLVRLIRATASEHERNVSVVTECYSDDRDETEEQKDSDDGEMEECVDVACSAQETWKIPPAVMRMWVMYYSRWAALADVCNDCLVRVSGAKAEVVHMIERHGRNSMISEEGARLVVSTLAKEMLKEVGDIAVLRDVAGEQDGKETVEAERCISAPQLNH